MVKTRYGKTANSFLKVFNTNIRRFGKTLTHRLSTNTLDAEERIITVAKTDTTFFGDLQFGSQISLKLISAGFVKAGEGLLYVSAKEAEAANIVVDTSIIIDGSTAGTYSAWNVVELLQLDEVNGVKIFYTFKLRKRTDEVIS